jgi:hypothetical protein
MNRSIFLRKLFDIFSGSFLSYIPCCKMSIPSLLSSTAETSDCQVQMLSILSSFQWKHYFFCLPLRRCYLYSMFSQHLSHSLFLLLCCMGVHCGLYKSSYNISNISYLNSPPPSFSFISPSLHSKNSFNRYHFST